MGKQQVSETVFVKDIEKTRPIDVIVMNSHGVGQVCRVHRLPRRGETMGYFGGIIHGKMTDATFREALQTILDASDKASVAVTDEATGAQRDSAVTGSVSPSYVLADVDAYHAFEKEVRALGLDDGQMPGIGPAYPLALAAVRYDIPQVYLLENEEV